MPLLGLKHSCKGREAQSGLLTRIGKGDVTVLPSRATRVMSAQVVAVSLDSRTVLLLKEPNRRTWDDVYQLMVRPTFYAAQAATNLSR